VGSTFDALCPDVEEDKETHSPALDLPQKLAAIPPTPRWLGQRSALAPTSSIRTAVVHLDAWTAKRGTDLPSPLRRRTFPGAVDEAEVPAVVANIAGVVLALEHAAEAPRRMSAGRKIPSPPSG